MSDIKFHIACLLSSGKEPFTECIQFYKYGLESLGYEVTYSDCKLSSDAVNLVLGSYKDMTWTQMREQAEHIIICNFETVQSGLSWFSLRYFKQLTQAHVWDYNGRNVELLRQFGVRDTHLVPLSYAPEMSVVPQNIEQDIDVLFYGQPSEHRNKVLAAIKEKGLSLVSFESHGFIFGERRDDLTARAKVVLNMHYFDNTQAFEMVRVSYLLANRKAVVAEVSPNTYIDDDIKNAVLHGHADELAQLCYDLVHDEARRRILEQKGFDVFSQRNAAKTMRIAVDRYFSQTQHGKKANECNFALPSVLNLGAGDQWKHYCCNIHHRVDFSPDLTLDINQPLPFGELLYSWRFGNVTLQRGSFQKIIAHSVFQRTDDLNVTLTNCLELLAVGGNIELTVPLDLSYDAWMQVDDKRVFNDKSWESIISNWWQYDWGEYRFEIVNQEISAHNPYGMELLAERQNDWQAVIKSPRAIDTVIITLHKRLITDDERKQLPQTRFMD